jgi:hypothetical protein
VSRYVEAKALHTLAPSTQSSAFAARATAVAAERTIAIWLVVAIQQKCAAAFGLILSMRPEQQVAAAGPSERVSFVVVGELSKSAT